LKGFKDSSGKFHPITEHKGVRKSRDQSAKTQGVKIRKARTDKGLEKMFEFNRSIPKDVVEREFDDFTSSVTDYGSADISTAVEKFREVGLRGKELADEVREFSDSTGTPLEDIDIVYVAYDHILQMARNKISEVLNYDFLNDFTGGGTEFYVAGNYMATSYDYSEEAVDELREKIKEASKIQLQELSDDVFVKSFLSDVEVF